MPPLIDLSGKRFGSVVAVRRAENNVRGRVRWLCVCDCGKEFITTSGNLLSGDTTSCGCARAKNFTAKKHGMSSTRLYSIWCGMKKRCYNKNSKSYRIYGAERKVVCDEWQMFEPFCAWAMANGYRDDLTIDRIDSTGNYEPANCRWATRKEQANNMRCNRPVYQYSLDGVLIKEHKTIASAAQEIEKTHGDVIYACKDKQRTAGGYRWQYVKKNNKRKGEI